MSQIDQKIKQWVAKKVSVARDYVSSLPDSDDRWVFVHVRSLGLSSGRHSDFARVGNRKNGAQSIRDCLSKQYAIAPGLRTYNELLLCRRHAEETKSSTAFRFGFGATFTEGSKDYAEFPEPFIQDVTGDWNFETIGPDDLLTASVDLARLRSAVPIGQALRDLFGVSTREAGLHAEPDEIRYAMQVLALWAKTFRWKFIETIHTNWRVDSLTGLVVTVCSSEKHLSETELTDLTRTVVDGDTQTELFGFCHEVSFGRKGWPTKPRKRVVQRLRISLNNAELCPPAYAFDVVDFVREEYFSMTHEGASQTFAFLFGHPGFLARQAMDKLSVFRLADLKKHRHRSEGAVDKVNLVHIFDGTSRIAGLRVLPVQQPVWASNWPDSEQAMAWVLSRLTLVHRDTFAVGLVTRSTLLVFADGEAVLCFSGAWQEIRRIADFCRGVKKARLREGIGLALPTLVRLAYGAAPRSAIVVIGSSVEAFGKWQQEHGKEQKSGARFEGYDKRQWVTPGSLETALLDATKTDGAIFLCYVEDRWQMQCQIRVATSGDGKAGVGTGTATAAALGSSNWLASIKVSRDGGLKFYHAKNCLLGHIPV